MNEASNQAQLHQDQVSTLVLQPLSQALLPISAEHLDQDVKSKAKPSFHPVLQPSSQPLLPVSAECLGGVKSKAQLDQDQVSILVLQPLSQALLPISAEHLEQDVESEEKDTRSKDKSMDHISLMKMLIRRMDENAGIENRTTLVKQVWEMDSIHASWMNLYTLPLKHPSHAMMSLETIFKIYATGIT